MKKLHNFEYKRTRKSMAIFFIAWTLTFILITFVNKSSYEALEWIYSKKEFTFNEMWKLCEAAITASSSDKHQGSSQLIGEDHRELEENSLAYYTIIKTMIDMCIPELFLMLVYVKLKSTQDILQCISKFDYLLKISIFQQSRSGNQINPFSCASESDKDHENDNYSMIDPWKSSAL
jgi:hypothetical protein